MGRCVVLVIRYSSDVFVHRRLVRVRVCRLARRLLVAVARLVLRVRALSLLLGLVCCL